MCVFFKLWGSNLSQFFQIHFKGVRLELLGPIFKKETGPAPSFYCSTFPALVGGVDRLYTKAFLSWSDLVCPLLMQVPY